MFTKTRFMILLNAVALSLLVTPAFAQMTTETITEKTQTTKTVKEATPAVAPAATAPAAATPAPVVVPGGSMVPTKPIAQNATDSKELTTLAMALQRSDLIAKMYGKGPFTVFAPTNDAFAKLPTSVMTELLKPEQKGKLADVLNYHIVPGRLTSANLQKMADANNGKAVLKTAQGGDLTITKGEGDQWLLSDSNGGKAEVLTGGIEQANGLIFVIDTVLMPKAK